MSADQNQNPEADPISIIREQVPAGTAALFSVVEDLEKGGKTLRIEHRDIEPVAPLAPTRAESPRRNHIFNSIADFMSYLSRYGALGDIVVAIDLANRAAAAVLNEVAGQGTEEVRYVPIHSREWAEVTAILGKVLSPREFSLGIRRLRDAITDPEPKTVRLLASGLSSSKGVEEVDSTGARGVFGHMVRLKASAGGQADPLDIPERLVFRVKPFIDSELPIELEAFVDLVPRGDGVGFQLEAPDAGRVFERAMEHAREALVKALGPSALVTYGRLERTPWAYLPERKL